MNKETNLKYIERKRFTHKNGVQYFYYYVRINQQHKYSTRKLEDAEEFVLRYAEKHQLEKIYRKKKKIFVY